MGKTLITSLLILFICTEIKAQEAITGPHGGRMKVAHGYKIESLGCDNYIEIYLFNEETDPIFNNGVTGDVKFFYDNKTINTPLTKYGIDGFSAKISSPDFSHYKVTLNLNDNKIISADFNECVVPKQ